MLRAMLVDDEPLALEGLMLLIDWRAEGFEICAQCPNAAEALARLPLCRPDLIVTDIRMPGMDGLALMQAARAQGFAGEFVVVSGYGDFEYAQHALRIGVAGYLLKPIDPMEAADVLDHVRRKLVSREASDAQRRVARLRGITALLAGQGLSTDTLPDAGRWHLATWGAPLPFDVVQTLLDTFPEGAASAHIVEDKEFLVLHLPPHAPAPDWSSAEVLLLSRHRRLEQAPPADSPVALRSLRVALSARLDAAAQALPEHVSALIRAVSLRQVEAFRARCAELEVFCASLGADVRVRAKRAFLSECARQFAQRPDALATFLAAQDAELEALGLLAIRLLAPAQERMSDRVVAHVAKHSQERLTIEGVAAALGYNPTYLGRVFREERGVGLREWLRDRRMDQAAQLLRETEDSVCAISQQVGYGQYKRFLGHFKQRYGLTPEQYRKKQARE